MRRRRKKTRCCSMYSLECLFGEKKKREEGRREIGKNEKERSGLSISLILTLLIFVFRT